MRKTCEMPFSSHWFSTIRINSAVQVPRKYRLRLFQKTPHWSKMGKIRNPVVAPDFMPFNARPTLPI